jgi:hypothetical protein
MDLLSSPGSQKVILASPANFKKKKAFLPSIKLTRMGGDDHDIAGHDVG